MLDVVLDKLAEWVFGPDSVESRPVDLALQYEDLVSERKDLSVPRVAGRKDPADSGENEACERGKQVHKTSTIPISAWAGNPLDHRADDFSAPSVVACVEQRLVGVLAEAGAAGRPCWGLVVRRRAGHQRHLLAVLSIAALGIRSGGNSLGRVQQAMPEVAFGPTA